MKHFPVAQKPVGFSTKQHQFIHSLLSIVLTTGLWLLPWMASHCDEANDEDLVVEINTFELFGCVFFYVEFVFILVVELIYWISNNCIRNRRNSTVENEKYKKQFDKQTHTGMAVNGILAHVDGHFLDFPSFSSYWLNIRDFRFILSANNLWFFCNNYLEKQATMSDACSDSEGRGQCEWELAVDEEHLDSVSRPWGGALESLFRGDKSFRPQTGTFPQHFSTASITPRDQACVWKATIVPASTTNVSMRLS